MSQPPKGGESSAGARTSWSGLRRHAPGGNHLGLPGRTLLQSRAGGPPARLPDQLSTPRKCPPNLGLFRCVLHPPALCERLLELATEAGADWSTARVLDPACGGGAFLSPVARRMVASMEGIGPATAQTPPAQLQRLQKKAPVRRGLQFRVQAQEAAIIPPFNPGMDLSGSGPGLSATPHFPRSTRGWTPATPPGTTGDGPATPAHEQGRGRNASEGRRPAGFDTPEKAGNGSITILQAKNSRVEDHYRATRPNQPQFLVPRPAVFDKYKN